MRLSAFGLSWLWLSVAVVVLHAPSVELFARAVNLPVGQREALRQVRQAVKQGKTPNEVQQAVSKLKISDLNNPLLKFDSDGRTVLHWAAEIGNPDVVKILLDAGAQPNVLDKHMFSSPYMLAQREHHTEVLKVLRGAVSRLHAAAENNDLRTVKKLFSSTKEANVERDWNGASPLHYAARGNARDTFDYLMEAGIPPIEIAEDGKSVLHWACEKQDFDPEFVLYVMRQSNRAYAVDMNDEIPVFSCVRSAAAAMSLLEAADTPSPSDWYDPSVGMEPDGSMHEPPTMLSVEEQKTKILMDLDQILHATQAANLPLTLTNKADRTLLHVIAPYEGCVPLLKHLIRGYRLDPNAEDEDGEVALGYAIEAGAANNAMYLQGVTTSVEEDDEEDGEDEEGDEEGGVVEGGSDGEANTAGRHGRGRRSMQVEIGAGGDQRQR